VSALGRTATAHGGQQGAHRNPLRTRSPQLGWLQRPVRRPPRTPFAVLLVIIAGVGLVGLLLINTRLQQGAVEISRLDRDNQILRERVQALTQTVEAAAAPQRLAARAQELGMVPNPRPAFLRISDGTVLGDPKVAEAPPAPPPPAPVAVSQPAPAAPAASSPAPSPAAAQPPAPSSTAPAPDPAATQPAAPAATSPPASEPAPAQSPATAPDQPAGPPAGEAPE
jgi:hypothetical protein